MYDGTHRKIRERIQCNYLIYFFQLIESVLCSGSCEENNSSFKIEHNNDNDKSNNLQKAVQ